MLTKGAIGIFDSGVGGLSVAREIQKQLPNENILYYADSAYCPYGNKKPDEIRNRSIKISQFLLQEGAKMLVVACNTASIAGLDTLRQTFPNIPIVGMEPAVKPAAKATQNGRIGVLATGVTLNGDRFTSLINRYASHIVVINQPCPGLVELVESGHLQGPKTTALLKQYLHPLLEQHIDTLVLGCTHYPFLYQAIQDIVGPNISIIDTGQAVAKQVQKVLSNHQLLKIKATPPEDCFYTSGDPIQVKNAITILLNKKIISVQQKDFSYITKANKYIYTQV